MRPTLRLLARRLLGRKPGAAVGADFRHGGWRRVALVFLAVVAIGLLGWYGRTAYRGCHRDRLVHQGREALARKDYRAAALAARNVLVGDSANLEASRIMAETADRAGSRDALWWRSRVTTLDPSNPTNSFAWAETALRLYDTEAAAHALSEVPKDARRTETFHALAATLNASVGKLALAEAQLAEALRLNPTNTVYRFNLARVRLEATNAATLGAGRQAMLELKGDPKFRLSATQALLAETIRAKDRPRAVALVAELKADPSASQQDRLVCFDAMTHMRSKEAPAYFEEIKRGAAARPVDAALLVSWMNSHGLARQALAWADTLPPSFTTKPPLPLALAESREAMRDWKNLIRFLAVSSWGDLEHVRLAMLARGERESGNATASKIHWQQALAMCQGHIEPLEMLARLAGTWRWLPEREEALWALVGSPGAPRWPLQALFHDYRLKGDTRGLLRVASRTVERDPSDFVAQNNEAMFRLLLGVETDKAIKRSCELWKKAPHNPSLVATQAFALHLAGHTREAVKLMETLPEALLRRPGPAVYYGILLAEAGSVDKARGYLDLPREAPLLPEEKALVMRARQKANLL